MYDRFITFQARLRPEALAVVTPERMIDFATFETEIDKVAAALDLTGAGADDAAAVAIGHEYRGWLVLLALARRGVTSACANDTACRWSITGEAPASAPSGTLHCPPDWFAAVLGRPAAPLPPSPSRDGAWLARILKTSGTAGDAKRVGVSWRRLNAIIRNVPVTYGGAHTERWLALTGPTTILGFSLAIGGWAMGNAMILPNGVDPGSADLQAWAPNLIGMVPHQLQELVSRLPLSFRPVQPLRVVTGGSALPVPVMRLAQTRLTTDLRSVYGASECGAVTIAAPRDLERTATAAGHIVPGVELEIIGEDGREVPVGSPGEIRIRSDRVADRYLDEPEKSREAFRDGWYHSGDVGRILPDGLLVVEGRVDDIMNLGGDKVLPSLIEKEILLCKGVTDAAAFSVPNDLGLQKCWIAVVADATFTAEALQETVQRHLGWLGSLSWVTVNQIPRNQMGKVQRGHLRQYALQYQAEQQRS